MDISSSSDLRMYITGLASIQDRLEVAKRAFFSRINIPPAEKEEIVLFWIGELLTGKEALQLETQDGELVWGLLDTLVNSKRMAALCCNQWMPPVTSALLQTIISTVKSQNYSSVIRDHALQTCCGFMSIETLSPLVREHCVGVTCTFLLWLVEGNLKVENIALAILLIKECSAQLRSQRNTKEAMNIVLENLTLPIVQLRVLQAQECSLEYRKQLQELREELEKCVFAVVFVKDLQEMYRQSFTALLSTESKAPLPASADKFFATVAVALEVENSILKSDISMDNPISSRNFLQELYMQFVTHYRNEEVLHIQWLVILVYVLGLAIPSQLKVEQNSVAEQRLKRPQLSSEAREKCVVMLLRAVEAKDLSVASGTVSLSDWLLALGQNWLTLPVMSASWYECIETLFLLSPNAMSTIVEDVLVKVISGPDSQMEKSTEIEEGKCSQMKEAYDSLLCHVLEIYDQLRSVPKLMAKLLLAIKRSRQTLRRECVIPASLFCHGMMGIAFLPNRFLSNLASKLSTLGYRQVFQLWTSLMFFLTNDCCNIVKNKDFVCEDHFFVSGVTWMLSLVLTCCPLVEIVTGVPGVAEKIAERMMRLAVTGIEPLLHALAEQSVDDSVCASVLVLCHSWNEVHVRLLHTDTGYTKHLNLLQVNGNIFHMNDDPIECCQMFAFVNNEVWKNVVVRVTQNEDQVTQLAVIQLVIQKMFWLLNFFVNETGSIENKRIQIHLKFIFDHCDAWGDHVLDLLAYHVASFMPFLNEDMMRQLASHQVQRYKSGHPLWCEFSCSFTFRECADLHPFIVEEICKDLIRQMNKRKISDNLHKNRLQKALKKVVKCTALWPTHHMDKSEDTPLWVAMAECGMVINKLFEKCEVFTNGIELTVLLELFGNLPLTHCHKTEQTVLLLVLVPLLLQQRIAGDDKTCLSLLQLINQLLSCDCSSRILSILDCKKMLTWMIDQTSKLWHTQKGLMSLATVEKSATTDVEGTGNIGAEFNFFMLTLLKQLVKRDRNAHEVEWLSELIVKRGEEFEVGDEIEKMLLPAMFLVNVCYEKDGSESVMAKTCHSVVKTLSNWCFKVLKHLEVNSVCCETAYCILTVHTATLKMYGRKHDVGKEDRGRGKEKVIDEKMDTVTTVLVENVEGISSSQLDSEIASKENLTCVKNRRCHRKIGMGVNLAQVCLAATDEPILISCAFKFLAAVAACNSSDPSEIGLLKLVWSSVSGKSSWLLSDAKHLQEWLAPHLASTGVHEYKDLLGDLLRETRSHTGDLQGILNLWRIVMGSRVEGQKGREKQEAVQGLVVILLEQFSCLATREFFSDCNKDSMKSILETLSLVLKSGQRLSAQIRALIFTPCIELQLFNANFETFTTLFPIVVSIVNSMATRHSVIINERPVSLLTALEHCTNSLVHHSSQAVERNAQEIQTLVDLAISMERFVSGFNKFHEQMNKVVHFTIASIASSMQHTTIYPSVKVVIERILYHLFGVCDSFCLRHLLVALPPAQTTLLKHLHSNYNKYHCYKPFTHK